MNLRIILAITRKDILDSIKHQQILIFLMGPLLIGLVVRFLLSNTPVEFSRMEILLYNPDNSTVMVHYQEASSYQFIKVEDGSHLMEMVKEKGALAAISIPVGFDDALERGERPVMKIYINDEKNKYLQEIFMVSIGMQISSLRPPPVLVDWENIDKASIKNEIEDVLPQDFLLLILLVSPVVMAGSSIVPLLILEEKERRTMAFLKMSPANNSEIIIGKCLTGLFFTFTETAIVIAIYQGWKGNWPISFLALFLGSVLFVLIGLFGGVFFSTANQLNLWSSVPMLILQAPVVIHSSLEVPGFDGFSRLIPTHYLVETIQLSLAGQATLANVGGNLAVLLGWILAIFALTAWALRKRGMEG